jgi:hypothetical protein
MSLRLFAHRQGPFQLASAPVLHSAECSLIVAANDSTTSRGTIFRDGSQQLSASDERTSNAGVIGVRLYVLLCRRYTAISLPGATHH